MERFFLEHHVLQDRDPDELVVAKSDSEASDDEQEITERVHSVRDPTGPWRQTPVVDGPWGAAAKRPGVAPRDFRSTHTGPKGVLNDYRAHKRHLRQERDQREQERRAALLRIAKGSTIGHSRPPTSTATGSNQSPPHTACDSDCDCADNDALYDDDDDDDDMLLNDAFLAQYNAVRMQEMQRASSKKSPRFGALAYVGPEEFVRLTDSTAGDVVSVIHLFDPENYTCGLLNQHLTTIAQELDHLQIAALMAKEADNTIAAADLPVLLIYRGSKQEQTLVNVSELLDGEFTHARIKELITDRTH